MAAIEQFTSTNVRLVFATELDVHAIQLVFHLIDFVIRQLLVIVNEAEHILLEVKVRWIVINTNVVTSLSRSSVQRYIVIKISFY